ncbi:MAG TPA: DUF4251 domain-containing protein [Arachidicoccus sp.]|nr:DUF4251 domain-containing protein [Arachidicoccus sp.]
MRTAIYGLLVLVALSLGACATTKNNVEKTAEQEKLGKMVQAGNFIYNATNANPQRINVLNILPNGAGQQLQHLSPGYYLSLAKDTLKVYLPFFGRAYQANLDSKDNGIEFETTDYKYQFDRNRRGYYNITIQVNNQKSASKFTLNISDDGYGTLQVQSVQRDQMSFYGQVSPQKSDIL